MNALGSVAGDGEVAGAGAAATDRRPLAEGRPRLAWYRARTDVTCRCWVQWLYRDASVGREFPEDEADPACPSALGCLR
jgi:hypothetical protein